MAKTQSFFDNEMFKMPDFSQWQTDVSRYFGDMTKMAINGKGSAIDMETVAAAQRKNLEAFAMANQLAFECFKTCCQRQADNMRHVGEEMGRAARDLSSVGTPEEKLARQAELAKQGFETVLTNTREVFDIVNKANDEAVNVLSRRITANFDEMKAALQKKEGTVASAKK